MKNILYINTAASGGGAAAVMQRLNLLMNQRGASTYILTRQPDMGHDPTLKIQDCGGLLSWCRWRGWQDYHIQRSHYLWRHARFQQADILHLHNLHGDYFNPWSLPLLSTLKPTVWTLHDMQAITGHCAYALDCNRWLPEIGCGHCPSISLYPRLWRDTSHRIWHGKQLIYMHSSLYLVTPSVWLQRLIEKSILREQPLSTIPNGADTAIFRPQDKQAMRHLLGIPQNVLLIGGCADGGMDNPWKGGKYTLKTVLELKQFFPNLHFLNIGVKTTPSILQNTDWVHHIPYVHDPVLLARLYAALDLLLYPSLADNHPLVCIESLCCGTPIVGFATGGIPEIVRSGIDGLLVPPHDDTGLTQAAVDLLQDSALRQRMSQESAISAAQRFNLELFAQRYEKVYEEALRIPRSLEKSRLPLDKVPVLVKSPTFMQQEKIKYPQLSRQKKWELLFHGIQGCLCIALATIAGWPLQAIRTARFLYRRLRTY